MKSLQAMNPGAISARNSLIVLAPRGPTIEQNNYQSTPGGSGGVAGSVKGIPHASGRMATGRHNPLLYLQFPAPLFTWRRVPGQVLKLMCFFSELLHLF